MSLQFIFGNSGSGKSDYLYEHVLEQAAMYPQQNFLILVPEQYTMQTQRELVRRQKNHAIMNVDVLSFARLAYRVFDELGRQDVVILEETGKNLVLRKVAQQKKQELKTLGGNMNKMGYVGEVKSLISELTQYNVSPEDLENFLENENVGAALRYKLMDILVMYRGFQEYMEGRYITAEEVLVLLCEVAAESALLRDSVIVFDEFTGFTPVQNRLLRVLLPLADRIMVSVTMDIRENFYHSRGVHELFAMSKKTVEVLQKLAAELKVPIEEPVILTAGEKKRYKNAPELFFMEQNLFRPTYQKWKEIPEHIRIMGLFDPREELSFAARTITKLIREQGYCYKDIAVVTGDVPQYANYVPEIFEQYNIPYFIDQTTNILFHPFIEFVRAALEVVEYDFSYQSVFRFLRSGLCDYILALAEKSEEACAEEESNLADGLECVKGQTKRLTDADIDALENYVLARGIRGRRRWSQPWTFVRKKHRSETAVEQLQKEMQHLNLVRECVVNAFAPLTEAFQKGHTVQEQTLALYTFISGLKVEQLLKEKEFALSQEQEKAAHSQKQAKAARSQKQAKAQEYAQIYRIVMDLLDKAAALLGDEQMTIQEYGDILDAGFSAAKVGSIPPGNDRVTIGDIERTRLSHVRILFFVGVNDGIVPKAGSKGSIISQFEREKMAEYQLKLAPGAREKVFIQKFYLYLNMTKPSDALYVTFSKVNTDGKALRRSYLIGTLLQMFPALKVEESAEYSGASDLLTPENSMEFFLEGLMPRPQLPAADTDSKTKQQEESAAAAEEKTAVWGVREQELWNSLAFWYLSEETYANEIKKLLDAACCSYTEEPIGKAVTRALYGTTLNNSVTRLERFAACAFAHYLDYGLHLRERELHQFASVDMGNIYHDALDAYAKRIEASEYTWFDLPADLQEAWITESMEEAIAGCSSMGGFEDAKSRYMLTRMTETVRRTVWALTAQVKKGKFVPSAFEVGFQGTDNLQSIRFALSDEEKMQLRGRIDRIDTCETEDKVYVKIIDYKSGNTSFSLLNLYHGLQLQLVVYLSAALELEGKKHPNRQIEPAGIFYYHIENPMVDASGTESEEEIRRAVLEKLKPNGLVNEAEEIYRAMDADFSGSSEVIPVALKADGSLKATSKTVSTDDFYAMTEYVRERMIEAGRRIFAGDVSIKPYELENHNGCEYCPYHTVCGFDKRIPGFAYKKLETFDNAEDILARMRTK